MTHKVSFQNYLLTIFVLIKFVTHKVLFLSYHSHVANLKKQIPEIVFCWTRRVIATPSLLTPFPVSPIRPHAAEDVIEVSDSDEDPPDRADLDAAEQRGIASTLTSGTDTDAEPDNGEGGIDADAPIWPGPDDRARSQITAMAHYAP